MEKAYQPELWRDLYVMLGTSSAALIGLLFVVTSLHLNEVMNKPVFRVRAYNQTLYLLILLVEAVVVLLPQPAAILGLELIIINSLALWLPSVNIYNFLYKSKGISHSGGWALSRAIRYIVAFLVGLTGGLALLGHANWGMFLVTASYVILLVAVVLNAWAIMLGLGQLEQSSQAN